MSLHLTPEEVSARAFGLETGEPHCDECSRRVDSLRAGRARLAAALEEAPRVRAGFPRLVSAIAAALCLGAVGFAVMSPRDPGRTPGAVRQDADQWLADLASEDPAVRDRATQQLASMGSKIEDLLKKSLATATDPEVKARLTDLLARIDFRRMDRLAVGHGAAVRILKTDGTLIREIRGDTESDVGVQHLAWAPNGAWLAFLGDNVTKPGHLSWPVMDLHVADAASGAIRTFAHKACTSPVWSSDSKLVAVGAGHPGETTELHVISTTDWKPLPLKASGTPCFWMDDSLVVFTGKALEKLDPATGATTKLFPAASTATTDGTRAFFYQRLGPGSFNLCMGDLKTLKAEALECGVPSEYAVPPAPRVSPDGRRIAFERRGPDVVSVDLDRGPKAMKWEFLKARQPAWAPDGRLAFYSEDGNRTVIQEVGNPHADRTELPGSSPAWAPAQEKK